MIMGEEQPGSGEIKVSASVKPAYMAQIVTFDDMDATVLDTLRYAVGVSVEKARSILAGFHFRAADVMKKVGVLSGGEKSRLKLCMVMQENVNFLLLDEPTNHLDIASREWLEDALADFEGTMLFVSHDRYFLNKFAEQVWSMDNGVITKHGCGFDEYLEITRPAAIQKEKTTHGNPAPKVKTWITPQKPISMEDLIREAEAELQKVNAAINTGLHPSDFMRMNALYEEKSRLEERISVLYDRWAQNEY